MSELLTMEGLAQLQPKDLTWEKLKELKKKVVDGRARWDGVIGEFVADQAEKAKKLRAADKVHDSYLHRGALQWVLSRFEAAAESLAEVKRDEFARELEADSAASRPACTGRRFKLYAKLAEKTASAAFDLARLACLRGHGRDEAGGQAPRRASATSTTRRSSSTTRWD